MNLLASTATELDSADLDSTALKAEQLVDAHRQMIMSASILCHLSRSDSLENVKSKALVDPIRKMKPFGWSGLGLLASTAAASAMGFAKDEENPLFDFPKKKRSIRDKYKPNFNWVSPSNSSSSSPRVTFRSGSSSKLNLGRKRCLPMADVEGFQKRQRLAFAYDRPLKLKPQFSKMKVGSMGIQITAPVMPQSLKDGIFKMGVSEIILVIQKPLYKSDLKKQQARLSIPKNQVRSQFLTEEEEAVLDQNGGVRVKLIQPSVVAASASASQPCQCQ